jgi:geranylgeranyl pyrophosphate synthase
MIVGQAADIEGEQRPPARDRVEFIHLNKTAGLFEAAARMGAIAARATETVEEAMAGYGRNMGLAFQIVDDILDHTSSAEELGKSANKDVHASKQTYPAIFGLDRSRQEAAAATQMAIAALEPLSVEMGMLRELAAELLERSR